MEAKILMPKDFYINGWHAGIKPDQKKDFGFIFSEKLCSVGAVFTKNLFVGNPIIVGREHMKDGVMQCVIVNSGNSNVATGKEGLELAYQSCKWAAETLKITETNVLPSSTGVIGRRLNPETIKRACKDIIHYLDKIPLNFAEAIITTDQFLKIESFTNYKYTILGIAKGAGMISPNMATMLSYVITDVSIPSKDLQNMTKWIADKTFNRISVDSDTSTSDTFVILANGASKIRMEFPEEKFKKIEDLEFDLFIRFINLGNSEIHAPLGEIVQEFKKILDIPEENIEFLLRLYQICLKLAKKIVKDGEGSTKIFRVNVLRAPKKSIAEKIGKSIINSPLVKTAIYGGDPNWGRLIMAIGKIEENFDISKIKIFCNGKELFPNEMNQEILKQNFQQKEIYFDVDLNYGNFHDSFWGCDLGYQYIKINADYTT
ncbi:MAG: bifunctional ornithine acetyltransferase/N-acetylglutamate synthase [Leptonema sp. (in: bacteria)]